MPLPNVTRVGVRGFRLDRNADYRFYSGLLEHVAEAPATRDPDYTRGISDEARSLFDPDERRKHYILLQEILTDLRLRERAELGRAFYEVTEALSEKSEGISFRAGHIDGRDRVFIFVASKKRDKAELFQCIHALAGAAIAHFQKSSCLVIVDRDGQHYDLALTHPNYRPSPEDFIAGRKHFGHLRISTEDISQL